uniref:C-type lectin domain-containing protein n=1 Tax=Chelonoidis abingdonii TaxID=106734 RepID=A0A8C0J7N0_CHEAB
MCIWPTYLLLNIEPSCITEFTPLHSLLFISLCSQGWLAFKGSCYKMNKSSKPWTTAQQICELSSIGAHLVDIQNEEEHIFISSYLQTVNQIIMLWTGLNDMRVSMIFGRCRDL